ncbi:MAG: hypothetical protein Alpg2KO_24540 [Alphaproteobacteria bacterium]
MTRQDAMTPDETVGLLRRNADARRVGPGSRIARFFGKGLHSVHAAGQRLMRPAMRTVAVLLAVAAVSTSMADVAHAKQIQGDPEQLVEPAPYSASISYNDLVNGTGDYWNSLSEAEKNELRDALAVRTKSYGPPAEEEFKRFKFELPQSEDAAQKRWDAMNDRVAAAQQNDAFNSWQHRNNDWQRAFSGDDDLPSYHNGMHWEQISAEKAGRILLRSIHKHFRENPEALDRFVPSGIARIAKMDASQLEAAAEQAVENTISKDSMDWVRRVGIDDGAKFAAKVLIRREVKLYEDDEFRIFGQEGRLSIKLDDIDDDEVWIKAKWTF